MARNLAGIMIFLTYDFVIFAAFWLYATAIASMHLASSSPRLSFKAYSGLASLVVATARRRLPTPPLVPRTGQ